MAYLDMLYKQMEQVFSFSLFLCNIIVMRQIVHCQFHEMQVNLCGVNRSQTTQM